jgi:hypothetical protein
VVIRGRDEGTNPESRNPKPVVMDSGFPRFARAPE